MTVTRTTLSTSNLWLGLMLCPLLAAGDTVVKAFAIGTLAVVAMLSSAALAHLLRERLSAASTLACGLLICATLASLLQLLAQAWFFDLNTALFVFLPLLAVNPALLMPWLPTASGVSMRQAARNAAALMACLLLLAFARELVGRGALFSDASLLPGEWAQSLTLTVFRLDMGFLLALLAPGALISLGLALAARNWLRQHRATGQA